MILKANQKYIDMSAVRHLLAHGEKNADFLTFEVDKNYHDVDLSDCTFIIRAVNSVGNLTEQTLKKQIDGDSIFLTWKVDEYFTAVSGVLKLEIRGIMGDELVIKYDLSDIIVRESAVGEGVPEIPDTTVIQGEKGDKGDDGLSAYEIWLSLGNSGTEADFIASLKGEKGEKGEQGIQGIQGENGTDGKDGKSAYETWLELGNTGTETDFLKSLKGEKGDTGERGLQGIQGEKGDTGERGLQGIQGEKGDKGNDGQNGENGKDGIDGFSPEIEVVGNTENAYKLRITDKNGSFETPNLKGQDGSSGGGTSVTIDAELSETSENPLQNKAISGEISALRNQISNLNDLISAVQTGGGNLKITTLFDSTDHEKYKDLWSFRCSQWDDRVFSFDEVSAKNLAFCNEENGCTMRFSNSFGWNAEVTALCSETVQINDRSVLIVEYHCTSDGDGMTAEIVPEPDFTSQKSAEFEIISAFYATNTFISANFKANSLTENGDYFVRFKVKTTNPAFTIRKISVVTQE